MTYFFLRAPVFPVILEFHGSVFGLRDPDSFDRLVRNLKTPDGQPEHTYLIDSEWGGFDYYRDQDIITPVCIKTRWTKRELIDMINGRINRSPDNQYYSTSSLGNKSKARVFSDLLEIVATESMV